MFTARDRGLALTAFASAPFMGPVFGPIVGGFVGETIGWRWSKLMHRLGGDRLRDHPGRQGSFEI